MKKLTVTEMKARAKAVGYKWFEKETMAFFESKIEAPPNKDNIFITSEKCWTRGRGYTLRKFNLETSQVETLGEFNQYDTLAEAREARKTL